jgi:hypothetical protein
MTSTNVGYTELSESPPKNKNPIPNTRQIAQPHCLDPAVVSLLEVTAGTRAFFGRLSALRFWSCSEVPSSVVWSWRVKMFVLRG